MKHQYITLLSLTLILSGALFFTWYAYQNIQSQEKQNIENVKRTAKKLSQLFEENLKQWQVSVMKQNYEDITVKESLARGDVALGDGKLLWPYGDFLSENEFSNYVNDLNKGRPQLNNNLIIETFETSQSADPLLIRLWLEQHPKEYHSVNEIEQLITLTELAQLNSQENNINFLKRCWTFKVKQTDGIKSEFNDIWRSVNIPKKNFEFNGPNTDYIEWKATHQGEEIIHTQVFENAQYYWKITDAGKKQIRQPRGRQGLYISLFVSACVLVYGLFFFLRSNGQLSRQAEQREQMVADISHELRTPVTTLRLYSEMLLDGRVKNDKDKQRYLKNMVRESNRLSRLINNVLDFSRMSRDKLNLNIISISLELFDADLKETIEGLDKEKRVTINLNDEVDFMGDLDATMQVIYNLINNAIKYAPEGPIEVSSHIDKEYLKINVRDYGSGIPKELEINLFEPFTRGKNVHKSQIQGSGLGLSVSRSLMETMGGTLTFQNCKKGAQFCASFKLAI